jgi:hypothetical protein
MANVMAVLSAKRTERSDINSAAPCFVCHIHAFLEMYLWNGMHDFGCHNSLQK